ncbi:hypothetical protein NHJ13051_009319 [Beauveria bassiana]
MSNPSHVFSIDGVYSRSRPVLLTECLNRTVNRFLIEFLDQGGVKPHVTFKLLFTTPYVDSKLAETFHGCRLSMEYAGFGETQDGGELKIKALSYNGSSWLSYASFDFAVTAQRRLIDWINDIRDLTEFDFAQTTEEGNMAGCRDFVSQSMITWNQHGFVSWDWIGQARPADAHIEGLSRAYADPGFHVLIGHRFYHTQPGRRSVAVSLPIHRGVFLNQMFRRRTEHRGHQIPYRAEFEERPYGSHFQAAGSTGGRDAAQYEGAGGEGSAGQHHVQYGRY